MDLDKLNNADVRRARRLMYSLLDRLQSEQPELQVLAPALFLRVVGDVLNVDLPRVFQIVHNMEHSPRHGNSELFRAMRSYVKGELKK